MALPKRSCWILPLKMKSELVKHIAMRLADSFRGLQSVPGGCIHAAYRLELSSGKLVFIKIGTGDKGALLEAEAFGLTQMANWQNFDIQVPQPLLLARFEHWTFLVLPWLEMRSGRPADFQSLGTNLARAHLSQVSEQFGWLEDGFIGTSPQLAGTHSNWPTYFCQFRLRPQWSWASEKGLDLPEFKRVKPPIFDLLQHQPKPSLVHGDLWSGNVGFTHQPALFDPAPYFADAEVDLAFSRMFGGFHHSFYKAYAALNPFPPGWQDRVNIYNLYHYLNHYNLFGSSYAGACLSIVGDLLQKPS